MGYNAFYQGSKIDEKLGVKIISENVKWTGDAESTIKAQVKWMAHNFANLNIVFAQNVLESVWYDVIETYNKNIEKCIKDETERHKINEEW